MASIFTLRERRKQNISGPGSYLEIFNWSPNTSGANGAKEQGVGYFACPQTSLEISITQRTSRTEYPGSLAPSEQILGSHYEPLVFSGILDDRYNAPGFAQNEMNRLSAVSRRGNMCEIEMDEIRLIGIVTSIRFEYFGKWRIGYEVTMSVHGRDGGDAATQALAYEAPASSAESFDDAALAVDAMNEVMNEAPRAFMDPAAYTSTQEDVNFARNELNEIASTVEHVEDDRLAPFEQIDLLVSKFDVMRARAEAPINRTLAMKANVELTAVTVASMLSFEGWQRGLRVRCRALRDSSRQSSIELSRRKSPDARKLYRPFAGESFYSVSNKFYGTPYEWRSIAIRNGIDYTELTGNELLIIPERGAR